MSFQKRLMWTPLWFLVGLVPVGLAAAMSSAMNLDFGFLLLVALTVLAVSYYIYRWLVAGLDWPLERQKVMAWVGVPLVLVAWGAFLSGVLFAICGIMGAGSGFHGG